MKITQQTSTILKLQVQNYFQYLLIVFAFAFGFSLIGLLLIILSSSRTTLNCNRLESAQIDCEITKEDWLTKETDSIQVTDLQSAELDIRGRGEDETYEIILITKNSRIPLTNMHSSGAVFNHRKQNKLLNSFIQASSPDSLTIRHDLRLISIIGAIFLFASPILIFRLLFSKLTTHCIFDKQLNQLFIIEISLLKVEKKHLKMNQLKEVIVTKYSTKGPSLALLILDSENIYLSPFLSNKHRSELNYEKYNNIAQSINTFINQEA
jgi:hypothetical protein